MKNCFEFNLLALTRYITVMGVFEVIDILNYFKVATGVITLDASCLKTRELQHMKHVATRTQLGLHIMDPSKVISYLVNIITNPGSPEEAYQINTALKTLDLKKNNNTERFYDMLEDVMVRRLLFTKLSQVYCLLIQEYKTNKEVIITLINNRLLDFNHVQELNGDEMKLSHYTIHNINSYNKLRRFTKIISRYCRDTNLIELVFEINFEFECYHMAKIGDTITEDIKKNACFIY